MTNIFVGNLSYQTTQADLDCAFAAYGNVERVTDRDTLQARGFAFVEMTEPQAAQTAISGKIAVFGAKAPIGLLIVDHRLSKSARKSNSVKSDSWKRCSSGSREGEPPAPSSENQNLTEANA